MQDVRFFIDTNVLLYLHDQKTLEKELQAKFWLDALTDRQCVQTNLQVLNEMTYVMLRKKWFATAATVYAIVDQFALFGDAHLTFEDAKLARVLHERYRCSWWDSLLIASALALGCSHFLSEDLQDGQVIDGLTIVDPFAHSPGEILAS